MDISRIDVVNSSLIFSPCPLTCRLQTDGKMFSLLLLSVSLLGAVLGQCPGDLADIPNAAFSASTGCIWADSDESHRFENFEEALARCR